MNDGSRHGVPRELAEIAAFREVASDYGCSDAVSEIFYDSNSCVCYFTLRADVTLEQKSHILQAAELTISQFDWDGACYHGLPMGALDDIPDEESIAESGHANVDYIDPASRDAIADARAEAIKHAMRAGREGEEALATWFSEHGLAYVSVCQNPETFAKVFFGVVKRPDFLLLFDALGLIAVDAKNLTPYIRNGVGYYSLPLDQEVKKAIAFERLFRMPVWYAIKGEERWYWISALKAIEVGRQSKSKEGKHFLLIRISDFVAVASGQDLAGLYGQRMPSYNGVASIDMVTK